MAKDVDKMRARSLAILQQGRGVLVKKIEHAIEAQARTRMSSDSKRILSDVEILAKIEMALAAMGEK